MEGNKRREYVDRRDYGDMFEEYLFGCSAELEECGMSKRDMLRYENGESVFFISHKTCGGRQWFVGETIQERVTGHLARLAEELGVYIIAFQLMSNHYHLIARFPRGNLAKFLQQFHLMLYILVKYYVPEWEEGMRVMSTSEPVVQELLDDEAMFSAYMYVNLNPVRTGLVSHWREYYGHTTFDLSINDEEREYMLFKLTAYRKAVKERGIKNVDINEYKRPWTLRFKRLPEFEGMSRDEYIKLMKKLARNGLRHARKAREGKGFMGREAMKRVVPGSKPVNPKGKRKRERVGIKPGLGNREVVRKHVAWYRDLVSEYRMCHERLKRGEENVKFPEGMYLPVCVSVPSG